MNDSTVDPRARMRQLRAIPDGQRTDAEWDELHELEIRLAPGNRALPNQGHEGGGGRPPQGPAGAPKKKFFHKRPRKPGGGPGQGQPG